MYLCHWKNTEMHSPSPSDLPPLTIRAFSLCPMSFTQFPSVTDKSGSGFQDLNNLDAYKEVREFKGIVGVSCFLLFTAGFLRTFRASCWGWRKPRWLVCFGTSHLCPSFLWFHQWKPNLAKPESQTSHHASQTWITFSSLWQADSSHSHSSSGLCKPQFCFWSLPMPAGYLWALLRGWTTTEAVHRSSKKTRTEKLRTKLRDSVLPVNTVKL